MSSQALHASRLLLLFFLCNLTYARDRWTELNIGPFFVDTNVDMAASRDSLTRLEQMRWVLGGLLDSPDLTAVWPVRLILTRSVRPVGFVSQNAVSLRGQRLLVLEPGAKLPLGQIALLFLEDNTPRLPRDVESGIAQLFDTLEAKGSRALWGGAPPNPDLAFARMQLFATKFEYGASFHIFLTSLKNGSTLRAAESNAFGRPYADLEKEAADRLSANRWEPASVSGRPLDPKRDFGEHSLSPALADVFLADAQLDSDPNAALASYRKTVEAGGSEVAAGYEGLAQLALLHKEDATSSLDAAIRANSRSAPVYLAAAEDPARAPEDALKLAKRAAELNSRWAAPLWQQAKLTGNPSDRETLLKKAVQLDRRQPEYWIDLARTQITNGRAQAAQGSWLRAEDAAPTEADRVRIAKMHQDAEAGRLDALEAERDAQENAAYRADQRAQKNQQAKVRAAEQRANKGLDAQSTAPKSADGAVGWQQLVPEKKLDATVVRVDCLGSNGRLTVKDRAGATLRLLWRNISELGLSCGDQKPPVRVSLVYSANPDETMKTDGAISTLRVWPKP